MAKKKYALAQKDATTKPKDLQSVNDISQFTSRCCKIPKKKLSQRKWLTTPTRRKWKKQTTF
jgi:hypothetical protein